jgi:hypothetical protein
VTRSASGPRGLPTPSKSWASSTSPSAHDSSHHFSDDDLLFIRMGHWTHEVNYGAGSPTSRGWLPWPAFFRTPADFGNFDAVLAEVGFNGAEAPDHGGQHDASVCRRLLPLPV